jgi:Uma2 family endonuclease
VLIATDKRQVEIYCCDEQDEWLLAVTSDGDFLSLKSVACRLTLDEIYEDVGLELRP